MPERIRSFIAFDLQDESLLKRFQEAQDMLVKTGADLRVVRPGNIHITMRFLGDISTNMIDSIHEGMKKVSFSPFPCEIRGVGVFPKLRYPRVVWAGIRRGADELENVAIQLEPHLRQLGFKPDRRGFSAHLTLARVKSGRNRAELVRCVEDLADFEFGIVRVDCLRLKKSVLTPKGPIYSTLCEVEKDEV